MTAARRPFFDLRLADAEPPSLVEPGRFLGRFDKGALERDLESAGILAALAGKGFRKVRVRLDVREGDHRLVLLPPRGEEPLVELRASEVTVLVDEPVLREQGVELLYALVVRWVAMQNPGRPFTADRPQLPGQRHPGLGIGRRVYGRLMAWAHEWGKDAVLSFPQHYHNAVFYSSQFRFVSPARQGRFEALRRDLGALPIAQAAHAIEEGRVREEPGGRPFQWEAAEMISPVTDSVTKALQSHAYREAVRTARDAARFSRRDESGV
jgi:hypothetical protein